MAPDPNFNPDTAGGTPISASASGGTSTFNPDTAGGTLVTPSQNQTTSDTSSQNAGIQSPFFQANPNDNPLEAGLKSLGNVIPSTENLIGGIFGAVSHPIKTVEGVGNAFAGGIEEGWNKLTGGTTSNQQTQTFDALKTALYNRYGSLDNAQKTATEDPVGFGTDVLSILEGGASLVDRLAGTTGVDLARTAAETSANDFGKTGLNVMPDVGPGKTAGVLNSTLENVAGSIVPKLKTAALAPAYVAGGIMGGETGVGFNPVKENLTASFKGGDANAALIKGLRGNTTPEELVNQARDALGQVVANRSTTYKGMLKELATDPTTYDISPITNELDTQLDKFGIVKQMDGTLDFSRSKFALDRTAQTDITNLTDYVKGYGLKTGDRTALGVDNLKQILGSYWSPNSDYRAFTEGLRASARKVLNAAPGYTKAMSDYSDMTDTIKDIKQSLSLGDSAAVETSFKKLTTALKDNDFRKQVLQDLDQATGGKLIPAIAGQRMSSWMPRGLAGFVEGGAGITAVAHGGIGIIPLLGAAISTSPRIVGEFVHFLGLGARGTDIVMNMLNKFATPAVLGGNARNRLIPQLNTPQ